MVRCRLFPGWEELVDVFISFLRTKSVVSFVAVIYACPIRFAGPMPLHIMAVGEQVKVPSGGKVRKENTITFIGDGEYKCDVRDFPDHG